MSSPDQSEPLATCQWLVSEEAKSWFKWLRGVDANSIGTLTRLRQELRSEQAAALLSQVELRKRAARKFDHADRMFFTDIGLQQSTDQEIAAYKAKRFPADQPLADLCCGIGGDLIALSQRGPTTAVDASADHLCFAQANVSAHGAKLANIRCGLAEEVPLEPFAAWHIDPDRRHDDRRTIRLDSFSPSLDQLEAMLRRNRNAALKLAPASRLPKAWEEQGQCEWISNHRECKQLVLWLGELAQQPGTRRAARIDHAGNAEFFEGFARSSVSSTIVGEYLFDPDPALVASGLVDTLAESLHLARLSPESHYLTGNDLLDHPLLQTFEVIRQEKVDAKRLKKTVAEAEWGTLELKQRGLELKLETLRKQLRPRGKGEGTIVFTPTVEGNRAILCRRAAG
ncbi:hypothetical protein Pan97_19340 [Bremerella volcania]|uniref:THUMP-like domain-containing protein n=1 Tax=Bremerella volcania TaxID=2527984 RepID=A0A518C6S9_9BACT|nr:class I SAM-dependent methyltransferase [Bremerella volcania]QDU74914.1 hypothetical protein Pan97_19340 [Bremerella volcania]